MERNFGHSLSRIPIKNIRVRTYTKNTLTNSSAVFLWYAMNMKKSNGIEKIKELLPYLAPLTIFAYISTITLQFGYYNAFGIDLFIFTPRIDPTSLIGIAVPISMG